MENKLSDEMRQSLLKALRDGVKEFGKTAIAVTKKENKRGGKKVPRTSVDVGLLICDEIRGLNQIMSQVVDVMRYQVGFIPHIHFQYITQ